MLFQQMFENTYPCFLTTRLIIKTQLKEIYENNTILVFKSNFFLNCSISELIKCLQSNLYETTILGTTQKRSAWTDGRLIEHFDKMTTN